MKSFSIFAKMCPWRRVFAIFTMNMKRTIAIIAAMLCFAAMALAQSKALGGRIAGYSGLEASYEHYLAAAPDFLEVEVGINTHHSTFGFQAIGIYNWQLTELDWTKRGDWALYAGPGVSLGTSAYKEHDGDYTAKAFLGITGQIGLEYTFWFPLQLSVDIRPVLGITKGGFYDDGLSYGLLPTLSVRYVFW